jgi:hypothetical protein
MYLNYVRLSGAIVGTYRLQYRPLSVIRYIDVNQLPTRYTQFITLAASVSTVWDVCCKCSLHML